MPDADIQSFEFDEKTISGAGRSHSHDAIIFYLAASIPHPLKQAAQAAGMIAQGDITQKIQIGREDEIGALAKVLNEMSGNPRQSSRESKKRLSLSFLHRLPGYPNRPTSCRSTRPSRRYAPERRK